MDKFIWCLLATVLVLSCFNDETEQEFSAASSAETTYSYYPSLQVLSNQSGTRQIQFENIDTVIYTQLPYENLIGKPILVNIKFYNGDSFIQKVRDTIATKKVNYTEITNVDNKTCVNCGRSMLFKTLHYYADGTKDSLRLYRAANSVNAGRFNFVKR